MTDHDTHDPQEWSQLVHHALGAPLLPGHRLKIYRNGDEIFPAMLYSINSASRSIEFLFFVYWAGDIAEQFCDALIERAEAGVRVRVLLDGFGSKPMPNELHRRFEASPVELRTFHPVPHWKFWGAAARTHRKILVVDGSRAFTGGVGIAKEWTGNADGPEHFRETQFAIEGPAVAGLRGAFHANWATAGGRLPAELDIPATPQSNDGPYAAVVASSGDEQWTEVALAFQLLTNSARKSLDIVTPYFVPGPDLNKDLARAARRGVRIRIMVSGIYNDHQLSRWAGQRYFDELLQAGIDIFEYDRTLLHTKTVIVDQEMSCIGSPNMNQRSQSLDEEIAVLVHNHRLARELLGDFDEDLQHCRKIETEAWSRRGLIQRLREKAAAFLEAQL